MCLLKRGESGSCSKDELNLNSVKKKLFYLKPNYNEIKTIIKN